MTAVHSVIISPININFMWECLQIPGYLHIIITRISYTSTSFCHIWKLHFRFQEAGSFPSQFPLNRGEILKKKKWDSGLFSSSNIYKKCFTFLITKVSVTSCGNFREKKKRRRKYKWPIKPTFRDIFYAYLHDPSKNNKSHQMWYQQSFITLSPQLVL